MNCSTLSTYRPMLTCKVQVESGQYTRDGVPKLTPPISVGCSPIIWRDEMSQTSIRTDKSGSGSAADHFSGYARFLIEPGFRPVKGMRLEVPGHEPMRVIEIHPRYGFSGSIHHWQVDLERWLQESE